MRRPRPQRRSASVRLTADGGLIEVRANDKTLGEVARLQSESESLMQGAFSHRPAYADYAPLFLQLVRALDAGHIGEAAEIRTRLEAQGVEIWHTSHEMRIDRPQTLVIADGMVRFTPNDAFLMMRTGGL
ncbi:MAG: hypothetical protein AB7L90_10640 [Hyphomicrobiaceae bacterium]